MDQYHGILEFRMGDNDVLSDLFLSHVYIHYSVQTEVYTYNLRNTVVTVLVCKSDSNRHEKDIE